MTTTTTRRRARPTELAERVAAADWTALSEELDSLGCAVTPRLLDPADCRALAALYDDSSRFRSTVDMARHRFGSGRYRYFADPLPEPVQSLREAFYPHLLRTARDWAARLGRPAPWPDTLGEWLTMCRDAGQTKSSQILLRYGQGDWNALHRDIFGEMVFPSRSSSAWTSRAPTTPAVNSCSSSSGRAHSPAAPPPSCGRATPWCSPPATAPYVPPAAGRPPRTPWREHRPLGPPALPGPGLPRRLTAPRRTPAQGRTDDGQSIEPPVTSKRWPVIQRDASEARNAATSAMSEGRPMRLNTE